MLIIICVAVLIVHNSESKVNKKHLKRRDSDDAITDNNDETDAKQEVVEVPIMEYEDDNKPSKIKLINSKIKSVFTVASHYSLYVLVPIKDVWAVKDGFAELPCDIAPPDPTDQVRHQTKVDTCQ